MTSLKTRRHFSLLLVFAIVLPLLVFLPPTVSVSAQTISMSDYIDGIDYTRLTQRAMRMMTEYRAFITLDKMEFEGEFLAAEPLTIEEINEVVFTRMNDMHLTLPEVKVFSSVGENLTREQKREIGKKLIVAISEYTQVAGLPGGGVLTRQLLYDNTNPTVENRILNVAADEISAQIGNKIQQRVQNVVDYEMKRMGKAVPATGGAKAGMIGFVFASVDAAQDLLDDSEFDAFCKKLEKMYARIAEFYASCSQKLNSLIEEKNRGRRQIRFDPKKANAVTTCKLLGVEGVKMKYSIEGSLVRQGEPDELVDPTDNSGTYEGKLKLVIEGYELDKCFDAVFADKCDLWNNNYHMTDWCQILHKFPGLPNARSEFLSMFIPKVNKPTILKRTLVGEFSVTLPKKAVTDMDPVLKGVFNSVSDSIDFLLEMNFGQEYKIPQSKIVGGKRIELGKPVSQWHLYGYVHGGKSVDSIHVTYVGNEAWSVFLQNQGVGDVMYAGKGADMVVPPSDFGDAWKPIEKAPDIHFESLYQY
ncbi:MAG: hypothetical protein II715_02815 [Clostridia bacterium]|nr:hypothetical protein [Clostridia bacterium]